MVASVPATPTGQRALLPIHLRCAIEIARSCTCSDSCALGHARAMERRVGRVGLPNVESEQERDAQTYGASESRPLESAGDDRPSARRHNCMPSGTEPTRITSCRNARAHSIAVTGPLAVGVSAATARQL